MKARQPVLVLDKVSKAFGGVRALNSVDLTLATREIVGLIGPNGAGKSTLFNVVTAFHRPDAGEVYLAGDRITGKPPHKICRQGIGRTFQLVRAFSSMSAMENVLVGAMYGGSLRGAQARQAALAALDTVGLADKRDCATSHLTLSDRRLLEVARALASMPIVILLDEPMAGLNHSEIVTMLQVIERMRAERGTAVLWVEHKVDAVFHLCDRVAVLDYGMKIADALPEQIASNRQFIEVYLGRKTAGG